MNSHQLLQVNVGTPSVIKQSRILSPNERALNVRGFFIVEKFLDQSTVAHLIDAIETIDADAQASRVRRGVTFARRNLLAMNFVQHLVRLARVQELLDTMQTDLAPVRAILFDKVAQANWTVPWHQDRSIAVRERIDFDGFGPWSIKAGVVHVQPPMGILRKMVTLRFHLDACGPDNGPLRVIPGTHDRILDAEEIQSTIDHAEQTHCVVGAGGLVAMRPLILHASSPAANPSHRRVLHIEFGPLSLPGGLNWAAES